MTAITHTPTEPAPRVWLLFGERRGDNAQVLALAQMLGWPHEIKQLRWQSDYDVDPAEAGISLSGLDTAASDSLTAPWPDIVVGIGYRSAPVSRWIGQQAGRVINIRLGRPRTDLKPYDLVITTPQYGLPPAPNVRELPLPLVKADDEAMAKAIARWRPAFEKLPAPRIAVLLGGPTQHMAFDENVARTLARDLEVFATRAGGSLLITSSPRSPSGLKAILESALSAPHFLFEFQAGSDNPYLALLALGDAAIVTSDSASMIADAAAFARPLLVYELPWLGRSKKPGLIAGIKRQVRERREQRGMAGLPADPLDRFYDMLTRMGRARPRRNVLGLTQKLYQASIARPFSPDADLAWKPAAVTRESQDRLVAEIKSLWAARRSAR
ncbi:MAG TPA: ELM1/GtrOC1 family putative glycosyltransferase [Dongiaceae bacterium]|nr:ELM1/GtrOC1 family putative glycosyltransferase [Dongiaceae bacterium]